jgi:4'-phosphopantetheinyl transferase
MDVAWMKATMSDVPADDGWLSANELVRLSAMRFPKRRAEWRLGRWVAKHAVAAYLGLPCRTRDLPRIEIHAASSGAPEVFMRDEIAPVSISLSHRATSAICALAPGKTELGCDLELVESRSPSFVDDYFTPEEQVLLVGHSQADQSRLLTALWSAKESALKALREGLRLDTRCVIVSFDDPIPQSEVLGLSGLSLNQSEKWRGLHVSCLPTRQIFHGWWQLSGDLLQTVVALPRPERLIPLCRAN